jgi:hypothetical protein
MLLLQQNLQSAGAVPGIVTIVRRTTITQTVVASRYARRAAVALIVLAGATANQTIDVPVGSMTLAGLAPTVTATANNVIAVPVGSLTLTGLAPVVTASNNQRVDVPVGSLTLTGLAPTVTATADDGLLSLLRKRSQLGTRQVSSTRTSWVALAPSTGQTINVPVGALTLTGFAPTVTNGAGNTIAVPLGSMTLTGFAPTVSVTQDLLIQPAPISWRVREQRSTRINPRWLFTLADSGNVSISVPVGSLTLAGFAPTVSPGGNQTVAVPVGSLTLAGFAPTVTAGGSQSISVPLGTLTLTGLAPTVTASANQTISVPVGSLTLTGLAPTVTVSGNRTIAVPTGNLLLAGVAPTVIAGGNQTIAVPVGTLTLTGFAPSVSNGATLPAVDRTVRVGPYRWTIQTEPARRGVIVNPRESRDV